MSPTTNLNDSIIQQGQKTSSKHHVARISQQTQHSLPLQQMLGKILYPRVDELEHEHAPTVTGMLLQMPQREVLHLLVSPNSLQARVAEATLVLRTVSQQQTCHNAGISQPLPIGELSLAFANASSKQWRRTLLGEILYSMVDRLEHEYAPCVTAMLLEIPQAEVLHLLESPGDFKARVLEARVVLKTAFQHSASTSQPLSIELVSALANASPEEWRRALLVEILYSMVVRLEHEYAPYVTDMLLEMPETKILHLLESRNALKARVSEAMEVLRTAWQKQPFQNSCKCQPPLVEKLARALAHASPEQRRMVLGEFLYSLVDQLEHEHAPKVTGMLLEMPQTEVLHLLESQNALKARVSEAMEVLRAASLKQPLHNARMSQPPPVGELASALAHASYEERRLMLGEALYPLVYQLEHEHAAKVTGMLLEMEQTEVLHLLESPGALKAKVSEAMEVLRTVSQQQQQQSGAPTDDDNE